MASNNIEIEIQVNIENTKPLLDFLNANGQFKYENRQLDEYFSPAHKDFIAKRPIPEWLRLRDANGKYFINYKNWHYGDDGKSHDCDEYETKVEDIEQARKILKALNFKPIVKVDKTRKVWTYRDFEISIDSVKDLGEFVEVEYIGKSKVDPAKTTKEMVKFLKDICACEIKRNYLGYPFLMLFPEEATYENV